MNTYQLDKVTTELLSFIDECDDLNYTNNSSLKALKFEWCLNTGGMWYATADQNKIISLSGIHPFKDGYRVLFRGAQLYPRPIGINRYHLQSHCWYYQLPLQLEFAKAKPVYITTNIENDASGKMTRIDKTFHHLAKSKIVSHVTAEEVFYTLQNVWLLNKENYNAIRF
jgi:hypothetical protein